MLYHFPGPSNFFSFFWGGGTSPSCPVCVFFVHSSVASRWKPNCATPMFGKLHLNLKCTGTGMFLLLRRPLPLYFSRISDTMLEFSLCTEQFYSILYVYIRGPFSVCMCVLLQNFEIDFGSETEPIPRDYTDAYMCDAFSTQTASLTLHVEAVWHCPSTNSIFFVKIEKGIFGNDCFWGCATQLLWMQLIPRGSYVCSYARVV